VVLNEPTSLNRGEGLVIELTGGFSCVESEGGGKGEGKSGGGGGGG
jgi:hypothetical protein